MVSTIYMTVADYWMRKKEEIQSHYSNPTEIRTIMEKKVLPEIGSLRISEISTADLDNMMRAFYERGIISSTRQMVKFILRRLFHMAIGDHLMRDNPVDGMKTVHLEYKTLQGFTEEQERALLRAFSYTRHPELYTMVLITGIPCRQLAVCRVGDFSPEKRSLKLERRWSKQGMKELEEPVKRCIPLSDIAVQILRKTVKDMPHEDGLFCTDKDLGRLERDLTEDMKIIQERSGLDGLCMQDIRHHFGVLALRLGANPKALNRYLGYQSGFNMARYASAAKNRNESSEAFDERVIALPERVLK